MFATFGAALILFANQIWIQGAIALGICGILVLIQVKFGTVQAALKILQKGNMKAAGKLLSKTRRPLMLSSVYRGYYFYANGYIQMDKKDYKEAKDSFEKALIHGLRMENDQAVSHTSLANIYAMESNKKKAKEHLNKAKQLEHNEMVDDAIKKVSNQIKSS